MRNKLIKSGSLIAILLLSNANPVYACTSGYTVAYLNGAWDTQKVAEDSFQALQDIYPTTLNGLPVAPQLLYNQTGCDTPGSTCLQDLAEVFIQRANELDSTGALSKNFVLLWESISGEQTYTQKLIGAASGVANIITGLFGTISTQFLKYTSLLLSNPPTAATMAQNNATLDSLAANGQYLVLVGHSQGNLFLNQSYDHIVKTVGASGVQAVQVAVAATATRGPYVTSSADQIIFGLSLLGSVPAPNLTLPSNTSTITGDSTGHEFVRTYLSTLITGIYNGITETPAQVVTNLMSNAFQKLGIPSCPQTLAAICPSTFTTTQLNQVAVGMSVSQVNNIFGCAGNNGGFSNWYIWDNAQSIASSTLDTAWVYFTNGIFQGGNGNKYITGNVVP